MANDNYFSLTSNKKYRDEMQDKVKRSITYITRPKDYQDDSVRPK